MVVYWFFFKPLSHILKNITLLKTCLLMGFFFFLPWLLIFIPVIANEDVDWYKDRKYNTVVVLDIVYISVRYLSVATIHIINPSCIRTKTQLPRHRFLWPESHSVIDSMPMNTF